MSVNLLLLAEAPESGLQAGLALAGDWQRDTGREARWYWPSHLDVPVALGAVNLRGISARDDPGAAIWLALCHALALGEVPLLVCLGHSSIGLPQLRHAHQLLAQSDAVFGFAAATDYALVGLTRAVPELFAGIPWGTNRVMSATRAQARRYGCKIGELALAPSAALG